MLSVLGSFLNIKATHEDPGKGADCGPGDLYDASRDLCARPIMVKASEEAAAIHEVGSEVRQRLKEKAPSPKLGSAGSHPPSPKMLRDY